MSFTIQTDLEKAMARIAAMAGVDLLTNGRLEMAWSDAFQFSQGVVPVDTGSLQGSATSETDFGDGVWRGEIAYGGPSPGNVHDPVEYADHVARYYSPNWWLQQTKDMIDPKIKQIIESRWDVV